MYRFRKGAMRKVRDTDLKVYMFDGEFYYDQESVNNLIKRHDLLIDKLKSHIINGKEK